VTWALDDKRNNTDFFVSILDDAELKEDDQQIDEQNNNSRKGLASGTNLIAIARYDGFKTLTLIFTGQSPLCQMPAALRPIEGVRTLRHNSRIELCADDYGNHRARQ
jgi:hypothetical protein